MKCLPRLWLMMYAAGAVAACGQKGPLVLPDAAAKHKHTLPMLPGAPAPKSNGARPSAPAESTPATSPPPPASPAPQGGAPQPTATPPQPRG